MRSRFPAVLLVAAAALAATLNTPAASSSTSAGGKDIPATITLDREHTSVIDRLPTGAGVNEFRGDNPDAAAVSYTDGASRKRITAFVGRNRHITLDGNNSSTLSAGRTAFLDLGDALGCRDAGGTSVRVDIDGVAGCDPCINTAPLVAPLRFGTPTGTSGLVDNFELTIIGEDYDDLSVGCEAFVTARLKFVIAGQEWELWWGNHARAGGATMNPEAAPLRVLRVSNSEWRFQTTGDLNGDHRAALYRQENPPANANEYHGQVHVRFSGKALALSNPGAPPPLPPDCDCQSPPRPAAGINRVRSLIGLACPPADRPSECQTRSVSPALHDYRNSNDEHRIASQLTGSTFQTQEAAGRFHRRHVC